MYSFILGMMLLAGTTTIAVAGEKPTAAMRAKEETANMKMVLSVSDQTALDDIYNLNYEVAKEIDKILLEWNWNSVWLEKELRGLDERRDVALYDLLTPDQYRKYIDYKKIHNSVLNPTDGDLKDANEKAKAVSRNENNNQPSNIEGLK
ncbi:MAG: hypothetical protein SGJ04_09160 [Bacteroidota bacterium]|nr:hypothetical protein [Bacteroidota bacterium]